jgi:hypothetical protein
MLKILDPSELPLENPAAPPILPPTIVKKHHVRKNAPQSTPRCLPIRTEPSGTAPVNACASCSRFRLLLLKARSRRTRTAVW